MAQKACHARAVNHASPLARGATCAPPSGDQLICWAVRSTCSKAAMRQVSRWFRQAMSGKSRRRESLSRDALNTAASPTIPRESLPQLRESRPTGGGSPSRAQSSGVADGEHGFAGVPRARNAVSTRGRKLTSNTLGAPKERQCENEFIQDLAEAVERNEAVVSFGCGAGVQAIAERFPGKPVYAALDTQFLGILEEQAVWAET